jgi:hypothetical protein
MLILDFEGYFQMRMATDPDPTDERRGVSGYTFALAGEPDLDAKIHLQPDEPGVYEREFGLPGTPGPRVGVTVRTATRNREPVPELVGAKVAFLDGAILEHNGLLVRDDFFIINPFHVRVTAGDGGEVLLERNDYLNPSDPDMPENEATAPMLRRRQGKVFTQNSAEVAAATNLESPANVALIANRLERKRNLELLLAQTEDAVQRAALESRIEQLAIVEQWWNLSQGTPGNRPIDRRAAQLALQLSGWNIDMNGRIFANRVGADEDYPWNIAFWMGGWDGDALCAYVKGTLTVPLRVG